MKYEKNKSDTDDCAKDDGQEFSGQDRLYSKPQRILVKNYSTPSLVQFSIAHCKLTIDAQNLSIDTSVWEPATNQEFEIGSDGRFPL